ncbi:MAG TPA: PilN domain-containing protein [bacterium]|jgi:Tfp pilus assembly protein PilN|nr:PilN domain-containing protein [bacterium]
MAVDLMRPALRQARPAITGARIAVMVNLAFTGLVLALILATGIQWMQQRRILAASDAQAATLQPQWQAVQEQTQRVRRLRRDVSALRAAFAAPEWVDVFEAVRAAVPPGLWLFRVTAADTGGLEVTARTAQAQRVAAFIQRLQATPGLRDVRLVLTETVRAGAGDVVQATIAAQVELP